ncbi:MAG TPA: gfo/Idh/MocA family oxidoreductase, partial [Xanthobacteraceae bacterium]
WVEILGETGTIRLAGDTLACFGEHPATQVYDLPACYRDSYSATIEHFIAGLETGAPFETAPQDNLETLRLVEDCYRLSGFEGEARG